MLRFHKVQDTNRVRERFEIANPRPGQSAVEFVARADHPGLFSFLPKIGLGLGGASENPFRYLTSIQGMIEESQFLKSVQARVDAGGAPSPSERRRLNKMSAEAWESFKKTGSYDELVQIYGLLGTPMSTAELADLAAIERAMRREGLVSQLDSILDKVKQVGVHKDVEHAYEAARAESDVPGVLDRARSFGVSLPLSAHRTIAEIESWLPIGLTLNKERMRREAERKGQRAGLDVAPTGKSELRRWQPEKLATAYAKGETFGFDAGERSKILEWSLKERLEEQIKILTTTLWYGLPHHSDDAIAALDRIDALLTFARERGVVMDGSWAGPQGPYTLFDSTSRHLPKLETYRKSAHGLAQYQAELAHLPPETDVRSAGWIAPEDWYSNWGERHGGQVEAP